MTAQEILEELKPLATENYRQVLFNHGAKEPCFGVKIGDMQKIQKRIKKDYRLSLELFDTGVYDAMYLAGMIADASRMTVVDLQRWVAKANCGAICGSTVAWVAAESRHGWDLAREWIDSQRALTATAGWGTLSGHVAITDDADLDLAELRRLLARVERAIHQEPDLVRYQMNAFLIAAGSYVAALTQAALDAGHRIGPVVADLGNNACQVPFVPDYIRKVEARGKIGRKRKKAGC